MNKTYRVELRRTYLIENLPEPLTRASRHQQFFDNFIENTRLCLRSIREPHTKEWAWILEQREPLESGDFSVWKIAEIFLNEVEHQAFEQFEGRQISRNERAETNELRFNRYFHELHGAQYEIDVFLNPLWGLILASVRFETETEMRDFKKPDFARAEVTQNEFFIYKNLIGKNFADVQAEYAKLRIKKESETDFSLSLSQD